MVPGGIVGVIIGLLVAAAAKRSQERTMRQRFGKDLSYPERERINYERIAGVRGGPSATSSMEYGCVFVLLPAICGGVGAIIGAVLT